MAAGQWHMTHIIKCFQVAGDYKSTSLIPSHLHFYYIVDLKVLSLLKKKNKFQLINANRLFFSHQILSTL